MRVISERASVEGADARRCLNIKSAGFGDLHAVKVEGQANIPNSLQSRLGHQVDCATSWDAQFLQENVLTWLIGVVGDGDGGFVG